MAFAGHMLWGSSETVRGGYSGR